MAAATFTDRRGLTQDAGEVAAGPACPDCPGEIRRTGWRFRVIHQATCPSWLRYQHRGPYRRPAPGG